MQHSSSVCTRSEDETPPPVCPCGGVPRLTPAVAASPSIMRPAPHTTVRAKFGSDTGSSSLPAYAAGQGSGSGDPGSGSASPSTTLPLPIYTSPSTNGQGFNLAAGSATSSAASFLPSASSVRQRVFSPASSSGANSSDSALTTPPAGFSVMDVASLERQSGGAAPHAGHDSAASRYEDAEGGFKGTGVSLPGEGLPTDSSAMPAVRRPPPSASVTQKQALITFGAGFVFSLLCSEGYRYVVLVLTLCAVGLLVCKYLSDWLLSKDDGTPEMRRVASPIREGAAAFLQTQYQAIAKLAVVVTVLIFFSFQLRPAHLSGGVNDLSSFTLGLLAAVSFCIGATCSGAAGYVSMVIAAQTNIRVTSAARRGYMEALAICFRGGAFSAILVLTMCVMGVTVLYAVLYTLFGTSVSGVGGIGAGDIPLLCVGYGFGASFVALFMQLGGGIYTKVRARRLRVRSGVRSAELRTSLHARQVYARHAPYPHPLPA
ncbi:hypothetical protein EON68_01530, partial [archaeon]